MTYSTRHGGSRFKQLRLLLLATALGFLSFLIVGCKDRYREGYEAGYAEGFSQAKIGVEKRCEERIAEEKRSCRDRSYSSDYSSGYSTEVCGGGGVTANGKHYDGGKTGCVRVYSDGRVVRY